MGESPSTIVYVSESPSTIVYVSESPSTMVYVSESPSTIVYVSSNKEAQTVHNKHRTVVCGYNNNNIYLKSNIHSIIRYKFSGLYNGIKHGIHIKTVQCI